MLWKAEAAKTKTAMIGAAYTAWLMGADKEKSFPQFLRAQGLVEKEPKMTPKQKAAISDKARKIAERIAKMDRPRKPKKKK